MWLRPCKEHLLFPEEWFQCFGIDRDAGAIAAVQALAKEQAPQKFLRTIRTHKND
jgi:hypothetical protein